MRDFPNWKTYLSTVAVIGAALFSATATATLVPLPAVDNPTTKVVTIGVAIETEASGRPPIGDVVFSESGVTLGVASTSRGGGVCEVGPVTECTYRLALAPGFATGRHTITASYTRDQPYGPGPPESLTFTVYVSELAWLPAVLDLLSD